LINMYAAFVDIFMTQPRVTRTMVLIQEKILMIFQMTGPTLSAVQAKKTFQKKSK
jgi:hypothetical protein